MDDDSNFKMPGQPRHKEYIYVHNHECAHAGGTYTYRPAVQGPIEFHIVPRCIEAGVELELQMVQNV